MGRIAGITIEIGGDTTNLQKSLKGVDSQLKTTQNNLKDINKLLKLNPTSTELLTQKQKNLKDAVQQTKERLRQLKEAQSGVAEGTPEWDALQREIIATEADLREAEAELRGFGGVVAQQLKAAGAKMKEFGTKVQDVGKKLSKISGVAAGALAGLAKIGVNSMKSADELSTLSQKTGVSTEELQKWSYASELVDVDLNTMTGAMSKMKKGMGSGAQAFEDLGVATKDADGNFRSATDVFYDTLEALSHIDNETERDIKAMEIFGKGADELAGIIDDGGAALKAYGEEAKEAGLIMSDDMVESLNEANDTMDKTKKNIQMSLGQLGGTLIEAFGPAIEKVAGFIGTLTEKIRNLSPEQAEMIVKILGIVAVIGPLVLGIGKVISIIGGLVSGVGAIIGVLGGPLTIAIAAAIAVGILLWKNWDKIKAFAVQLAEKVKAAWESLKAGVQEVVGAVTEFVSSKWSAMVNGVTTAWNTAKSVVIAVGNAIKTGVTTAWTATTTAVSSAVNNIKSRVTTTWTAIKSTVTTVMNGIKSVVTTAWNGVKSAISSAIASAKSTIQGFVDKINNAKTAVKNAIDAIKGILSGELSFPHIKIPHFSLSGKFSLQEGTVPKITVSWYKKAYQNPVMFSSPTVMATPNGLKGFGDGNGAEIVLGLDKLRELVGAMDNNVSVNVYLQGDARQIFKVVRQENSIRTKATNYNALAVGG